MAPGSLIGPLRPLVVFVVLATMVGTAAAHPLGNFTINHFSRLEIGSQQVTVRHVVDMAEIPAFQELQSIGSNGKAADGFPRTFGSGVCPAFPARLWIA